MMNTLKFVGVLLVLLVISTGCSETINGQYITVQKLATDDTYEDFNKITKRKEVRKAREILDNVEWETEKIETKRSADYRFQFPFKNDGHNKMMSYYLWVSSDDETVEVTTDLEDYVHLSEEDSLILLEILTEEK